MLTILAGLALIAYVALAAIFFFTQRSLLYYPSHAYMTPTQAHANPSYREIEVRTEDGVALRGWYAPAKEGHCTIVFFHGNADQLATASEVGDAYIAQGYGFLVAEYRGYSGLPGKPTEKGLYADGRAYMHYLMSHGVDAQQIVLYGHSLGTGVATEMATEFHVGGVMLLAPYLSIPQVGQTHFAIFPVNLLALDRFDNERKIGRISSPLLIANGTDDQVIPPRQGRKLFELAHEPKEFHPIPGRGHNDAFDAFEPISVEWMLKACHCE
ncbi:MAG TPA: alpha/beta hydrolase [Terracidiphilus sp.]|nr:alpha/beta hydrolase [Terracidiphilus sp.]